MFFSCEKLSSINFGLIDTSNVVTFNSMFHNCKAITTLDLSKFDTSSVTDMSYMFSGCSFSSFIFPNWNAPVLETMERMFNYCEQLEEIDFSNLDATSVTNMKYMFNYCSSLISVDLSVLRFSNLETIDSLFCDCTSLEMVDASNINSPSLINIDSMFFNCENLTSVDFTNFDTSNVEIMNNVFYNCINLKSLDLSSWDISSVSEMESIFSGCNSLIVLEIPNFFMESLISSDAFEDTELNQLRYINIRNMKYSSEVEYDEESCEDNGCDLPINFEDKPVIVCQTIEFLKNTNIYNICCTFDIETKMCTSDNYIILYFNNECSYANGFKNNYRNGINFINYNGETITDSSVLNIIEDTHLEIHFKTSITSMEKFFSQEEDTNMQYVISIDLSHFDSSSVINMGSMFYECSNLESIKLSNLNLSNVNNMEKMFYNCNKLNSIDFSKFGASSVINISYLFYGCSSLETINLQNFEVTEVINMVGVFERCSLVNSIDLSKFDTKKVENMDSMFSGCSSLYLLNLSNFETPALMSMNNMFYDCSSLNILDISNFDLSQVRSVNQILNSISNLKYINLYNTIDRDIISTSLLNTDNTIEHIFYVCQKTNIITNIKSLNCCDFYDNEAHCDNVIITTITNYISKTEANEIKVSDNIETEKIIETDNNNNINNNSIITTIIDLTKLIDDIYRNTIENIKDESSKVIHLPNAIFQFSTVEEQLNNTSNEISSVDLGECEKKLRIQEGLNETEEFLMVKLDIKNSSLNATYVQYEIFNPHNFTKVSLEICKNITIKIKVPVPLEESQLSLISNLQNQGFNAFDINDSFYNDICSTYTAQNGADMVLSLRKTLIYDSVKEIYLCQEECEFESFDSEKSTAECNCLIQETETVTDESKISFSKKEFFDSFYNTLYNSNFRVLKCLKLIFSFNGFKENYGCYTMTLLSAAFISFIIVHIIKGNSKIMHIMKSILISKGVEIKTHHNIKEDKNDKNKEKNKEENKEKIIKRKENRRQNTHRHSRKYPIKNLENVQAPQKRNNSKSKTMSIQRINMNIDDKIYNTKDDMNKETIAYDENKSKLNIQEEKQILEKYKDLIDVEKDKLDYEIAIIIDKRTFCQYYISLLKRGHLIIFTFITTDDYNLRQIKILLFIVSFALYFCINAFFFTDKTMNNIYDDNGIFNFLFQLPQILFSSIISVVINMILEKLTMTEDKIIDMKQEEDKEKLVKTAKKMQKCFKIKIIIFLGLSSILMFFFGILFPVFMPYIRILNSY